MTADKIKESIRFTKRKLKKGGEVITAKLIVRAVQKIDLEGGGKWEVSHKKELLSIIKENLKESIMKNLYDDQRRELYNLLKEFVTASPYDQSFIFNKILNIGRYQPLTGCNK